MFYNILFFLRTKQSLLLIFEFFEWFDFLISKIKNKNYVSLKIKKLKKKQLSNLNLIFEYEIYKYIFF